jgi:protocatechuate 3,4-dioxygenase beta subunit
LKRAILSLFLSFIFQTSTLTTIDGVVLDSDDDRPVSGVLVSIPSSQPGTTLSATTDTDGRFTINSAGPGRFPLTTIKDGYSPARADGRMLPGNSGIALTVKAGEPIRGLRIHIAKVGVISGRVFDTSGRPVTRARVAVLRKYYDDNGAAGLTNSGVTSTDDRGEYRVFNLEAGSYFVFADSVSIGDTATAPTYFPGTPDPILASAITVKAGSEVRLADLTVPVLKGASVRLHIDNKAGELPPLMNVEVRKNGAMITNRGIPAPLPMDVFSLNALSPGTYSFAVGLQEPDGFFFGQVEVQVDDSPVEANVTVHKGWRVRGHVDEKLADGTLRPVGGVRTTLGYSDSANTSSATSAADGNFVLTGVSEGLRPVRVSGLAPNAYILTAQEGESDILVAGIRVKGDTSVNIVVGTSGGTIKGTIVNSDGNKIGGGIVALIPDESNRAKNYLYRTASSDQNGEFAIAGIAPGPYHVFAWRELAGAAYLNADFMKPYEGQGMEVKVDAGGTLTLARVPIQ